jgi:hypothetical protein
MAGSKGQFRVPRSVAILQDALFRAPLKAVQDTYYNSAQWRGHTKFTGKVRGLAWLTPELLCRDDSHDQWSPAALL